MKELKEDLETIFSTVNDWLKFAEAKNAALITLNGAIIFGIIQSHSSFPEFVVLHFKIILLPLLLLSLIYSMYSFLPQLNYKKLLSKNKTKNKTISDNKNEKAENDKSKRKCSKKNINPEDCNIYYYDHIRHFDKDTYYTILKNTGQPEKSKSEIIEKALIGQIIANSIICHRKYFIFKFACIFSLIGIFITVILVLLHYYFHWNILEMINDSVCNCLNI